MPKGRMSDESIAFLFSKKVISIDHLSDSRQLIFSDDKNNIEILLIRSKDVGTYVEQGAADLGIIGYDMLREYYFDVFIPLKLPFGNCRLSVAYLKDQTAWKKNRHIRVATKYPNLASEFFYLKGYNAEIISLYGSIETAPISGISDVVVDLVSTGKTLEANDLVEDQVILHSHASLVVNPRIYVQKRRQINKHIDQLYSS